METSMETYESKLVKELIEKMDNITNLKELCGVYYLAIKELTTVYEHHVDRIIRKGEQYESTTM